LNPGEAAFINNPFSTNFTLTFVGTVPQGLLTNNLVTGFNLVSSIVPQGGSVDTNLGITPGIGDTVFLYNGGYTADTYSAGGWSSGFSPISTVGQGFFYNNVSGGTEAWVVNFTVN
jgi:hypothetical protein